MACLDARSGEVRNLKLHLDWWPTLSFLCEQERTTHGGGRGEGVITNTTTHIHSSTIFTSSHTMAHYTQQIWNQPHFVALHVSITMSFYNAGKVPFRQN